MNVQYYIFMPKRIDDGPAAITFWLHLVMMNGKILRYHGVFLLQEFNVLISAIESFIE